MAPGRRRGQHAQQLSTAHQHEQNNANETATMDPRGPADSELFIDPMLGIPLAVFIEKDVQDRDHLSELVTKHGGIVSPGYSSVPYILVDPLKPSGQNLYRQYANKKGKVILDARWVQDCVNAGHLLTFHNNWGGCKVTGEEMNTQASTSNPVVSVVPVGVPTNPLPPSGELVSAQSRRRDVRPTPDIPPAPVTHIQPIQTVQSPAPSHPPSLAPSQDTQIPPPVHPVVQPNFPYPILFAHPHPRPIHPTPEAPWPPQPPMTLAPSHIAPQQTQHIIPRNPNGWDGYEPHAPPIANDPVAYDYRYRDEQWGQPPRGDYYEPLFEEENYEQPHSYIDQQPPVPLPPATEPSPPADPSSAPVVPPIAGPSTIPEVQERPRGRKRMRGQSQSNAPAAPATSLVANATNPPARSPTPPARVVKSTYGGNLFTAEDVVYLKKYIDYCQDQGLVLSLREICERIAVKAPHHTFYSWRRYCNKHQIRLGGYVMSQRAPSPADEHDHGSLDDQDTMDEDPIDLDPQDQPIGQPVPYETQPRNRSPTPPRALFRSTTGKGVAFTQEDVAFLVRFMQYRRSQGPLDMVAFWKDVATKAPHHSRASWMKYWRRHKHELDRTEGDEPLPAPPDKKMRYSREDDILLARYFAENPEGTLDKKFQAFGRLYPHHPWKGWQEHHRIHKAKIDHLVKQIKDGEPIDVEMTAPSA